MIRKVRRREQRFRRNLRRRLPWNVEYLCSRIQIFNLFGSVSAVAVGMPPVLFCLN